MSMKDLNKKLEKLFKSRICQSTLIKKLDELIEEFGIRQVNAWRNLSNGTKNTLLHELVEKKYSDVVRHVISKYNLRIFFKRELDGATPLELARSNQDWKMWDLLIEFGDDKTLTETYQQFADKKQKDKTMNIVWMDLEFTSFHQPQILECAIIITDKELHEIERNQWIVHFDEDALNKLSQWHQNAFKDIDEGGNGLFADVLASNITKEQMEEELLEILKRHCPEKACPLAGSSIHIDKEVLKVEMARVHEYLHYRVIDVSSFREMMKRWAPVTGSKFARQLASDGHGIVNHRAMDDIMCSIQMMKMFKPLLTSQKFVKKGKDEKEGFSESSNTRKSQLPVILSSIDSSELRSDEKQLIKRIEFEQEFDVRDLQLSVNEQRIYDENPHLREVFINNEQLIYHNQEFNFENRKLVIPSLNRSLSDIINPRDINTTEYWRERKTLLSEIEFLTNYGNEENCLIIYAGAAPRIYLNYLSSLFPQLKFVLIDDKHFLINETDQITILNEPFTDELANKYSSENVNKILFICNIRTFTSSDKKEEDLIKDINDQIRWQNIIKPNASLFRFNLPSTQNTTEFFQGNILLDLWSSKTNIESRLIVEKDATMIEYNHIDFERAMRHFHNVTRTMFYENHLDNIQTEGLDHCYDCRAEIFILQQYLIRIQLINDDKQLKKTIAQLSYDISRNIHHKNRRPIINAIRTLNIIK